VSDLQSPGTVARFTAHRVVRTMEDLQGYIAHVPRRLSAVVVLTLRVRTVIDDRQMEPRRCLAVGSSSNAMLICILERRGQYDPAPNAPARGYASRPVETVYFNALRSSVNA